MRTARSSRSRPTDLIVWLGGTFGVGKTTTARLVDAADDRLRLFDPERVGYLLHEHLSDQGISDFQQH